MMVNDLLLSGAVAASYYPTRSCAPAHDALSEDESEALDRAFVGLTALAKGAHL